MGQGQFEINTPEGVQNPLRAANNHIEPWSEDITGQSDDWRV